MTDKKLTPRVGDRVLISPSNTVRDGKRTHVGTIRQTGELPDQWQVDVDGQHRYWLVGEQHLTVVDREPVEWPEGWSLATFTSEHGKPVVQYDFGGKGIVYFKRGQLEHQITTGSDMLERWDELVGDQ